MSSPRHTASPPPRASEHGARTWLVTTTDGQRFAFSATSKLAAEHRARQTITGALTVRPYLQVAAR